MKKSSVTENNFEVGHVTKTLVNKKLEKVNAVQTLSRLNRISPGKDNASVLDFVNETEEIKEAFQPYYETTILSEGTDTEYPLSD